MVHLGHETKMKNKLMLKYSDINVEINNCYIFQQKVLRNLDNACSCVDSFRFSDPYKVILY